MTTKQSFLEKKLSLDDINKFRREVQNMRKEAGLQMWNKIKIYYQKIN